MYFSLLHDQNVKSLVQDLCIHAALANGVLEDKEKFWLEQYAHELNLPPSFETNQPLNKVLVELKSRCTERELRLIALEILALLVADGKLDATERGFMQWFIDEEVITKDSINRLYANFLQFEKLCAEHIAFIEGKAEVLE